MSKFNLEEIQNFFKEYHLNFFSCDGQFFTNSPILGNQVMAIESENFILLLQEVYSRQNGEFMSSKQIDDLKIQAKILARKNKQNLAIRIGYEGDKTWLSLDYQNSVKINSQYWEIITNANFPFLRDDSSLDLPLPEKGGNIWDIKNIVKLNNDLEYLMVIAWFINLFYDTSYPFLILIGQEGSAKTSSTQNLKNLLDPVDGGLRSFQRNADDIYISAQSNMILGYDNISHINLQLSDELCRISTGGSISKRKHYSNSEQIILKAKRAVLMNGIDGIPDFPDFISRSVIINLQALDANDIKTDEEVRAIFNKYRPSVLGAILDLVVKSKASVIKSQKSKHRLATYHNIGCWLAEELGFKSTDFEETFNECQSAYRTKAIEDSFFLDFIRRQIDTCNGFFTTTASDLLTQANKYYEYQPVALRSLPKDPSSVGRCINRYSKALGEYGIKVQFERTDKKRIIYFSKTASFVSLPSEPNQQSGRPYKPEFTCEDIPF
jgi:hypothetical protein